MADLESSKEKTVFCGDGGAWSKWRICLLSFEGYIIPGRRAENHARWDDLDIHFRPIKCRFRHFGSKEMPRVVSICSLLGMDARNARADCRLTCRQ